MIEKLKYDIVKTENSSEKALVEIHGWQGNRYSMSPIIKSKNIKK